jgi:hypothetical protein
MNQKAVEFVQNQLLRGEARLKSYIQSVDGRSYPKRYAYFRIESQLRRFLDRHSEERWVVMPGISGMGKTTILAQIHQSFRPSFKSSHILSVSLDDAVLSGVSLKDIIDAYEDILGVSYEDLREPVLLLVDEAHRDAGWSSALKVLWGRSKKIFTICTGSSAVLLAPHIEDVGRRISVEKLYPLSFTEYSMIKKNEFPQAGPMQKLKESIYSPASAASVFTDLKKLEPQVNAKWAKYSRTDIKEYLSIGTLPFALQGYDEASAYLAIGLILDKLIQKDILELGDFETETMRQIKPIMLFLAKGSVMSVSTAGSLFGLSKKTLQDVLDVLVKAEILIRIPPFKADNKPSKYLFMCPALRNTLLDISGLKATADVRLGDAMEDVVALHFYREFLAGGYGKLTYDPEQGGADFILDLRAGKRLVIEVGHGAKGVGQVKQTLDKVRGDYGIIFNADPLQISDDSRIVKVPHDFFFLL